MTDNTSQFDKPPVPFRASNYDYRVRVGEVVESDAISWEHTVFVKNWDDVEWLAEMVHETHEYPAFKIDVEYRGEPDLP